MRLTAELPDGEQSFVLDRAQEDQSIADILRKENHPLNTRCGQRNLCGSCLIEIVAGRVTDLESGAEIEPDGTPVEWRSCQVRCLGDVKIRVPGRSLLAYQPQILTDYRINVPVAKSSLCPGKLGAAIDIGTTTVVVQLVDPESGSVLSQASSFNRQMHLGDDVLTRINLCLSDPESLPRLQAAVANETLAPLLAEVLQAADRRPTELGAITVAGNTTMLHLLAGVNPGPMGLAPFTPEFVEHRVLDAGHLGWEPAGVPVHLLPSAAAYVGADLTAGAFATGLVYDEGPSLLVDVGTNGEIILARSGRLLGCATAAGPAFEGAGLGHGLRAGEGAISHIRMEPGGDSIDVEIIGAPRTKPTGICGSAYIDFLAEARREGWLSLAGRIEPGIADKHPSRFVQGEYGLEFLAGTGQGKRAITISEPDIASLLQAKAAIAAGIETLLHNVGMEPRDVKKLYLAGGFGMHMRLESAIGCGLLPGFELEQIELVGNTSLGGAYLSLLDDSVITELARIGSEMQIVELNLDPEFEMNYIGNLMLP